MTRTDGLQCWRARRRRGDQAPQGCEVLKHDLERNAGPIELERAVVVPSDKHGINVMLERALELNPWWRERALEASSSETAWKAEYLPKLRCPGAPPAMVAGGALGEIARARATTTKIARRGSRRSTPWRCARPTRRWP